MPRIGALAVLLTVSLSTAALAQAPTGRAEPRSYSIGGSSAIPLPVRSASLVRMDEVQRDLKLTETQKQRHTALMEQQQAKVRKARGDYEDSEIFQAARNAILDDLESATQDALEPGQRERLEQIRLQVQGPLAFEQRAIQRRLDLSDNQTDEIEAIVEEGMKQLRNTSSVVVVLEPGDNPQTLEAIRELVGGLESPRSW